MQVAVRVRVFNGREKDANAVLIIRMTREMQGSKTFITNPDTGEEKEFKFDYSFNSHKNDPAVGPFATQDSVFEDLGKPVLANALEGKNVCLFAYGQTGAGKSYSMIGRHEPGESGIIPRTCEEIFRIRDASISDEGKAEVQDVETTHEITTEVMEIYCEQVNDLLLDRKQWPPKGYNPRAHPKGGFACPEVLKSHCENYEDVQKAFDKADKNRSIGSHALNPSSSRAHTIFKIEYTKTETFKQLPEGRNKKIVTAQLYLVDLAGSERTESAGTSGQMLKEGNAINLSLTALGNTIKAMTTPGEKPRFRDSRLTMLLMQSMTTGKVIMIAAVSPASICYEESISTLRFAERIKMVKIKVAKNVTIDPVAELQKQMEEMRQRMQEEIDQLKAANAKADADPAQVEELRRLMAAQADDERQMREELKKELELLKETAEERAKRLEEVKASQEKGWEGVQLGKAKVDYKCPHLLNLNEEPRLAETLVYPIDKPVVSCGRTNPDDPPVLEFNGLGMVKNHCTFDWDEEKGTVILKPGKNAQCCVNGKRVTEPIELKHNYRVWLGSNYAFRFAVPGKEDEGEKFPDLPDGKPDYDLAMNELASANAPVVEEGESEKDAHLRHQLNEALRKIEQANIISTDLEREATFAPKIIRNRETKEDAVVVQVQLPQGNFTWPWEQFQARLVDMVTLWQSWQYAMANNQVFRMPEKVEENPFIDNDYQLIGESEVYLASLGNMLENPVGVSVLSITGVQEGRLNVNIEPLGKDGSEGPDFDDENDPFVDNPDEIKDTEIQFMIKVENLVFDVDLKSGGQPRFKDVFVRYKFNSRDLDEKFTETKHDTSGGINLRFDHKSKHKVFVDAATLNHIMKGKMTFQVWGKMTDVIPVVSAPVLVLPTGWKKVTAYQAPDGSLHLQPPAAE